MGIMDSKWKESKDMIKLIIFDLDGVLIDAKEIHYEALNKALTEAMVKRSVKNIGKAYRDYGISREDHLSKFDGLNTKAKLKLLTQLKGLPESWYDEIFDLKQKYTIDLIKQLKPNKHLLECLANLPYKIAVASNSIRDTVKEALVATQYIHYINFYLSNEDVTHPKPATEMYLQCMIKANVSPKETLIIEDSYNGRLGAEQTGALVMGVNSPDDVTCENIDRFIKTHEGKMEKIKWKEPKLNVLIPMAGRGSRFEAAGYTFPKPLIEVHGKPMIQVVVENLNIEANYIFLVQKEHYEKYNLKTMLNLISPGCKIVIVDGITEGAACTALLAKEHINNDNPLLIANSDQFLEWGSGAFMYHMMSDAVDGGIVTFKATHPKWSFVKIENGWVKQVAEKNPISDDATVGVYFWKRGRYFVNNALNMIHKNIRTNNEFYIAPVYNECINDGGMIKPYQIDKMWGIGTPEDLDYFMKNYKNG